MVHRNLHGIDVLHSGGGRIRSRAHVEATHQVRVHSYNHIPTLLETFAERLLNPVVVAVSPEGNSAALTKTPMLWWLVAPELSGT
jgi:hypothetical protein